MRSALAALNAVALLLLAAMTDLELSNRLVVAAILIVNLVLLFGRRALATKTARRGVLAALLGYATAVGSWLTMGIGCGIEYISPRCDAIVTPLIWTGLGVALFAVPASRLVSIATDRGRQ